MVFEHAPATTKLTTPLVGIMVEKFSDSFAPDCVEVFNFIISIVVPTESPNCKTSPPPGRHCACTLPSPLKPVIVAEVEFDGEKTPKEYRTPATITMISMAQP